MSEHKIGHIYEEICKMDNLEKAARLAMRGKKGQSYGAFIFRKDRKGNLEKLQDLLLSGRYKTSHAHHDHIKADRKMRDIYKLPLFPDRILHHAIIIVIEPYLMRHFIDTTCASVKGKGIHYGEKKMIQFMKMDPAGTAWIVKTDYAKFYPSVVHDHLMKVIKTIFKDKKFLALIEEIISSHQSEEFIYELLDYNPEIKRGLPIGWYTSQPLANLDASPFDHYVKEKIRVKYYIRYCDDCTFFAPTKGRAKQIAKEVIEWSWSTMGMRVKPNVIIQPTFIINHKNGRKRIRGTTHKKQKEAA